MGQALPLERQDNDTAAMCSCGTDAPPRTNLRPLAILEIDPTIKDRVLNALLLIKGARLVAFEEPPR